MDRANPGGIGVPERAANRPVVLIVGPSIGSRGGIASFIGMMAGSALSQEYELELFSTVDGESSRLNRVMRSLGTPFAFAGRLVHTRPALVHVHSSQGGSFYRKASAALLARLFRVPYVFHVHGSSFDVWATEGSVLRKWVVGRVLDSAGAVIALSESWKTRLASLSTRGTVVSVHNGVSVPSSASSREFPPVVVFLGRLSERKGIDLVARAAVDLQKRGVAARWVLAGDGSQDLARGLLRELPEPDAVTLPGWLGPSEKAAILSRATVFVLPSTDEGLPLSMLEAMSYGLTCVVTRVGGIPEAVSDRVNGLLVDPADEQGFEAAVHTALCDRRLSEKMGAAARSTVLEGFSEQCVIDALSRVYEGVLQTSGSK